jgi:asparagine synthase (glutamine-hydrolysing)
LDQYILTEMIDRSESGFSLPLNQWLGELLKAWAENMLSPSALDLQGYFKSSVIQARWHDHLAGHRDHSAALWPVLIFQS